MANFTVPSANTSVKGKDEIDWQNVDPATLPKQLTAKYTKLREAIDTLASAKADFEGEFSNACQVAAGHRMVFSYRFGLACGVVPEKTTSSKGKVAFGSLAKGK